MAKKAHNAKYAADILNEVFSLGVEDPRNIVSIKTGLHRRIHTDIYYGWANSVIISAYESANGDKEKQVSNVSNALASVRTYVLLLDCGAPF